MLLSSPSSTPPPASPPSLDLDVLEHDHVPTFVLKIGTKAAGFEILFCNEAFRRAGLREVVLGPGREALLFRSWTQAVGGYSPNILLLDRIWAANIAGANQSWKVVRAVDINKQPHHVSEDEQKSAAHTHMHKRSRSDLLKIMESTHIPKVPLRELPGTHIHARWESMQTMMEMTDVGVFEYEPSGRLIHANDAWYRLSNYPRGLSSHDEFSFMDLAYEEDHSTIMSAWNTLVQGNPVTFEMRWKARPDSDNAPQWVLSACVPVLDEDRNLVTIAGNTIDINAQKKSAEAAQTKVEALEQARLSEAKFTTFAQLAPIAIYIFKPGKGLQYVNDQFFELTGTQRTSPEEVDFAHVVIEEDVDKVMTEWEAMMQAKTLSQMEYRLKKTWVNQEGVRSHTWVQGSSYPELDKNGNLVSVMGTIFDISHFKWAESVQRQRIEEALEAKRQQENFIDMTSHELRNPLSAVVQCADSVLATLQHLSVDNVSAVRTEITKINDELVTCIDSMQTIVSCSLHQKRIIDDVLTLSKLDSNLLLITPMRVQPVTVVSEALKMFEVECNQMHITLSLKTDSSLTGFEWVMIDPSRMLQVLINLLTNAIKFTKDHDVKEITVTLGGSWTRPSAEWQTVTFAKHDKPRNDACDKPEWGLGSKAFLWFKVDDTGCGMTNDEQKKLFSRFTQATPRTHIKYGGSGLGLFISKSLAALQGGSVGVRSDANTGSTFLFYISTRIATGPEAPISAKPQRSLVHSTESVADAMKAAHLNILMVEDNLVNQKVLSKQLQKAGCNVSVAGDGVEALEWLKRSVYWCGPDGRDETTNGISHIQKTSLPRHELDIVLMDIEMPVMDGLTCARHIRDYEARGLLSAPSDRPRQLSYSTASPLTFDSDVGILEEPVPRDQTVRLPILAVSANARSEQVAQAIVAGMDDAISKPFRIPELWPKMVGLVPRCSSIPT